MNNYVMWVAALAACLCTQSAMADGNQLLKECEDGIAYMDGGKAPQNPVGVGHCVGVIQGTLDTLDLAHAVFKSPKAVCQPDGGISMLQTMRVVVKFLKEHPDRLHLNESGLVTTAMWTSFPCPQ
ncbi:hypothetical protein DBR45_16165 [Pseudomonas sp. HMWF031]|nr:hypothetical protein DBR45_16165 [Pseudomonas sp. HMWF031]